MLKFVVFLHHIGSLAEHVLQTAIILSIVSETLKTVHSGDVYFSCSPDTSLHIPPHPPFSSLNFLGVGKQQELYLGHRD